MERGSRDTRFSDQLYFTLIRCDSEAQLSLTTISQGMATDAQVKALEPPFRLVLFVANRLKNRPGDDVSTLIKDLLLQ